MAKKPAGPTVFKPKDQGKPIVMSAADSAAPVPPAAPAAPTPVASGQEMSAYDSQYNAATTDAQRQAIVAARDETAAGIAAANDAYYEARAGGGGSGDVDPNAYEKLRDEAAESRRVQNATATMQALMAQYGLTSLQNIIIDYIKQGYDEEAISVLIRTTPEYKTRFPAMEALSKRNRAISEASYIDYEQTAAALEKRYGLPSGMLMGNVTGLLTNDVSASELNDRVMLAASASLQAPTDLKNTFKDYYGIDSGGLTAYFLDPTVAAPLLEKQYASTVIGTEAVRQGLAVDVYSAENLQSLGITQEQAQQGFETVAGAKNLTQGRGDITTQKELISGTLTGNVKAQKNIERVAGSRVARFKQGGQYVQNEGGTAGLGTAATR